jgi:LacI family transcriptional regulator
MQPRIVDIARIAEVSPSAVSLVLNHKKGVSVPVRQKILDVAKELGYKPVSSPSRHKIKTNITIRLLKIALHGHIVNDRHNPFITEYLEGIELEVKKRRYKLEVSFFNRVPIEEIIESLQETRVDGYIILGTELHDHELTAFKEIEQPIVFIDTYFPLSIYDCVDMDNVDGIFKLVQYLYNSGHRSIGLIKSNYETRNFKMREFGFYEAMNYFSLPIQEKFIIGVDPTFDGSYRDMIKYLGKKTALPTAFLCMNDIISYGVMKALRNLEFYIPDRISIVGFDDLPSSSFSDPPLTTIRVSTQKIGERALEKLSEKIIANQFGLSEQITENILISGKLVIRKSVRPI